MNKHTPLTSSHAFRENTPTFSKGNQLFTLVPFSLCLPAPSQKTHPSDRQHEEEEKRRARRLHVLTPSTPQHTQTRIPYATFSLFSCRIHLQEVIAFLDFSLRRLSIYPSVALLPYARSICVERRFSELRLPFAVSVLKRRKPLTVPRRGAPRTRDHKNRRSDAYNAARAPPPAEKLSVAFLRRGKSGEKGKRMHVVRHLATSLLTPRVSFADSRSTSGLFSACLLDCRHLRCLSFSFFSSRNGVLSWRSLRTLIYCSCVCVYPVVGVFFGPSTPRQHW